MLLVNHKTPQRIGIQPELDGVTLTLKSQVYSLCVLPDPTLSLDVHVSAEVKSAFAQLKLVVSVVPIP